MRQMHVLFVFFLLALFSCTLFAQGNAQWVQLLSSINTTSISMVGAHLYVGMVGTNGDGILLCSNDNGNRWDTLAIRAHPPTRWFYGWGPLIAVDSILVGVMLDQNPPGTYCFIARSTDGGHTWIDTTQVPEYFRKFLKVGSRLYSFAGGTFSSEGDKDSVTIRSSTNHGMTWETVKQSYPPKGCFSHVAYKDSQVFCSMFSDGLYRCTPSPDSWMWTSLGWGSSMNSVVSALEVMGDTLFSIISTLGSNYVDCVYRTTDDGSTWQNAGYGLELGGAVDYLTLWSSRGLLFAASDSGLFVSTNGGDSWRFCGEGLPRDPWAAYHTFPYYRVSSMAFTDSFAFVGTNGSLWRRPLSEMITSTERIPANLPTQFSLSANYPNPFNPSTTIRFNIPKQSPVTLTIFDLLGRDVATLVNETLDAGSYKIIWNAGDNASGVYFYCLKAGGFEEVKKLILLR